MVCLLLGSGGSLVADAAGITYLNPTTWDLSMTVGAKVEILSNGGYRITSTASSITAFMADLESGSTYDLTIRLTPYNAASDGTIGIGVVDSNGDVLTLFEAEKAINGTSYLKSIKFKVPDNFVSARLVVVSLNVSQLIFTPSQSSLTDSSTDKGILNSLKEGFAKLWEWLKGIWDSIKEIPTKIAASLTTLGDRIKDFFRVWGIESAIFLLIYGIGSKHSFCLRRAFSMNIPQNSMCLLIAILVFWLICLMNYLSSFRRS